MCIVCFLYYVFGHKCHYNYFCFFFSSRRRHTRLQGDWSSDVCSSDLPSSPVDRENHCPGLSGASPRSEEHTSELQSPCNLVCRLLLEKKKKIKFKLIIVKNKRIIKTNHKKASKI